MNRLKELRIEKGLLQSDIAKIINKSERTVGFYESGERDMGTETLSILADYFNTTIDYILCKSNVRTPIDISNVKFANHGGLDTEGLTDRDIEELKAQIEFKRKYNKEKKDK